MEKETPHRGYLFTVLGCFCPRCREGRLFRYPLTLRIRKNMEMFERCSVCGQPTEIEIGFYYGTGYVSYLLGILITVFCFLAWWLVVGFSYTDRRFFLWVGFNSALLLLLQPWLMRFSRSLWLSFFVGYDPDWKQHPPVTPERVNKDQMNNW